MELNFDIRGNLKPYERIELSYEEFREFFVDSFEKDSTRYQIFEHYQITKSKMNKQRKRYPKGYIEIKFGG